MQNFLLTYQGDKGTTFAWFDTEQELWYFVEQYKVHVIEAFHIKDAEIIG